MTHLNYVYGILTNGDNEYRKTTSTRDNAGYTGRTIAQALLPAGLPATAVRALSEMYIRLCMSDKETYKKLLQIDPINSYKLQPFYEGFSTGALDIDDIVRAIKKIGLADEENSFLAFDYILNAMKKLIDSLDVNL